MPKVLTKINNLVSVGPGSYMFRSECQCFHCKLKIGKPVDGHFFEEVENVCNGLSTDKVMVQVCVHKSSVQFP